MKDAYMQVGGGGVRSHAYLDNILRAVVVWKITAKRREGGKKHKISPLICRFDLIDGEYFKNLLGLCSGETSNLWENIENGSDPISTDKDQSGTSDKPA